jgi:methionyl-tRNA synthetase
VTAPAFHERYERELANDLGNLVSRTTALIAQAGGELDATGPLDAELAAAARALHEQLPELFDRYEITTALDRIWDFVRRLNRYVEQTKPWELARDPGRRADLDRVLHDLADGLRVTAVALAAYVPGTSERILAALGQPAHVAWDDVSPGRTVAASGIGPAEPLFPRIDAPAAA